MEYECREDDGDRDANFPFGLWGSKRSSDSSDLHA